MFHHVIILILALLVFLLSTAHCDQLPDNDDATMYGTQSVITDMNAYKYDTETTSYPFYTSTSDTPISEKDETVSQPSGFVRTPTTVRTAEKPSSILNDNAEYDFTSITYPMTQNVANVDDRITRMYEGSEKITNLENSEPMTTPFPVTEPALVDVCDTDQIEVTINPMQINAFTNGTSCSLLVTAPNTSTAITVKLLKSGLNNVTTYFYIEHLGNLPLNCSNRYLLVSVDHFPCVVVIGGNKFRFHFQNTETTLEISTLDVPMLPCWNTDSPVFESKQCNATPYATKMDHKVEQFEFEYDKSSWPYKTLNVNLTRYLAKCVDLCTSCKHTLGYRERLTMCTDGKDSNATTRLELIVYQPAMKGLSFAYMGLHAIQPNAFPELEDLEVLNLEHNSLLVLPLTMCQNLPYLKGFILGHNMLTNLTSELFKGQCEQNLLRIDLHNNKLTYIGHDLFNSTTKIRYLDVSQNRLVHISTETFNTLKLLEHLNASSNYISNLTTGVFGSLGELRYLDLSDNNIASLPAGVFDSLGWLRYLYLSDNNIASLPAGVFDSLGWLRYLYLSDNNIASLPAGVFDSLGGLWDLDLSDNNISSLPAGVFGSLGELWDLVLSDNNIASLPPGVFGSLGRLWYLSLSDNNIASLPAGLFDSLGRLEYLYLSDNNISSLPAGVFDSLGGLWYLYLSDNNISSLPAGVFDSLGGLWYLYLSDNNIPSLPDGVFDSLGELRHLYLSDNNIASLPAGVFDSLGGLWHLFLSDNNISSLPAGVFDSLGWLRYLSLSDNNIASLPAGVFDSLGGLWHLFLSDNNISSLPAGVFDSLGKLRYLYLSDNNIASLPAGVFDSLGGLMHLYLRDNNISSLPVGVFDSLGRLEYLVLSDNRLLVLPDGVFKTQDQLTSLDLSNNNLTITAPHMFASLTALLILDMNKNRISRFPPSLLKTTIKLQSLDLSKNCIKSVHIQCFSNLSKLIYLNMSRNLLSELPSFSAQGQLQVLDLSENKVKSLKPAQFYNLEQLAFLSLCKNALVALPDRIFHHMNNLRFVNVSDNMIQMIGPLIFSNESNLQTFDARKNTMYELTYDSFKIPQNATFIVDKYATCCFLDDERCLSLEPRPEYLTCNRMLRDVFLRISVWALALSALICNGIAYFVRSRKREANKVQTLLISHLALSDLLMGVNMLLLAAADVYYGEYFPSYAHVWRQGFACKLAGFLSIFSCEGSVFFITLISIDRLLGIKYPFDDGFRFTTNLARICVSLAWLAALLISVIPIALTTDKGDIYSISEVCIGIPIVQRKITILQEELVQINVTSVSNTIRYHPHPRLIDVIVGFTVEQQQSVQNITYNVAEITGSQIASIYSIVVFIGVNLTCFIIVACCYMEIFRHARKTTKKSSRTQDLDEEMRMAKRMFAIVFTDFCCWVPLGLICIFTQSGVFEVSPQMYAWTVGFILPINSSINPFLYVLCETITDHQKKRQEERNTRENIEMRTRWRPAIRVGLGFHQK